LSVKIQCADINDVSTSKLRYVNSDRFDAYIRQESGSIMSTFGDKLKLAENRKNGTNLHEWKKDWVKIRVIRCVKLFIFQSNFKNPVRRKQ
jgi:hypothetical protein